ncbi:ABC transporter substrate-binding protein [Camelliibacillus cellulosilyticus]|uniref:ABC transporter substrate-binding protein n=1 Tax=Camelliibacillus cellulosilyticus TaxID=2174486 RepID=A0ABV9GQ37_9BACL
MKKQPLLLFVVVLLGVIGLSGCNNKAIDSGEGREKKQAQTVTLTMVQTFTRIDEKDRIRQLEHQVHKLEKHHPGLTIKMSAVAEKVFRDDKLPIAMTVGDPPDIFDLFGGSDTRRYAEAGRLLDLTDFLNHTGIKDQFMKDALKEFTIDGHIYGLPRAGYAEGFFYNKAIFEKLHLNVPKSWHELETVIRKTKQAGYTPIAMGSKAAWVPGMILNAIIIRNVGIDRFKGLETGAFRWTDPLMTKSLNEFNRLIQMNAFPPDTLGMTYDQQSALFEHGKAAMIYTGTWSLPSFTNHQNAFGFFMFPSIPGGKGDQTSINAGYSNGWGFSAHVNQAQKQAIYDFIKLVWSKKEQKEKLLKTIELPAVKLTDYSGVDSLLGNVLHVMDQATGTWPAYDAIISKPLQNAFNDEIQKVIGGVDTPEQALENIQKVSDQVNSR